MANPIRVGIVGANAERGWALDAHLKALQALPGYEITAVSARDQALADSAAQRFGATRAFGDTLAMVRDPQIDLVVVTIKVPEHRAVVLAALAAGKHVYCEWPLGRDLAEAEEMAAAVPPGVHAVTGLQGLHAPAIRHAAKLIADGAIGRPLSASVFSSAGAWGTTSPRHYAYLQDKRNGATLETIGGGHVLPLIETLVGDYAEVDARNSILHRHVTVQGTEETVERTCADHMFVLGLHRGGCVSSLEIVGGSPDRNSLFEVQGEEGWLRIIGTNRGTAQIAALIIEASVPVEPAPGPAVPGLSGPSANVAELYVSLLHDLRDGTHTAPDFSRAVRLTRLLGAIDMASDEGRRQAVPKG